MARISRLETESESARKILQTKYNLQGYTNENEYSGDHPDAIHDENDTTDLKGKGTGTSQASYILPNENASKTSYGTTLNTEEGGGAYDIDGKPSVDGGRNGRKWAMTINTYAPNKYRDGAEYGRDTIDTENFEYYFRTDSFGDIR